MPAAERTTVTHNHLCVVHPDAQIGQNVTISPFVTIAADVVIGDGTWIGPNVHIMDGVRIGRNCRIFSGAIVGSIPQDLKFKGEKTYLKIGDNTTIREYCTLNVGTAASWETVIGSNCLIMAYVHIAHDCVIGNNCILANNVTLAGHIEIGNYAVLGGMAAVHQFVKIGESAMIGGGSLVRLDVPPFITAAREPLSYAGVNKIGLKRRGFSPERITHIQDIYRILFVRHHNLQKAIPQMKEEIQDSVDKAQIMQFIEDSERGLLKGFRTSKEK
jgi:UDP-N-acetylglucosamine acyltransferase